MISHINKFSMKYLHTNSFKYKYSFLLLLFACLITCCQCGLVAYSTILDGKENQYANVAFKTFQEIWLFMFLWAFFSIFMVHVLASAIALATLRKHKYGRFICVLILLYGTLSSLVVSCITSAVVAFVLYQAKIQVLLIHAMFCGFCQLGLFLFLTFFTLKPTL